MSEVKKDIHYSSIFGARVPLPQFEGADGNFKLIGENNPLPTQLTGSNLTEDGRLKVQTEGITLAGDVNATIEDIQSKTVAHTFQNAVSAVGEGTAFVVGAYKTLTVEIYGTSTAREVKFYGKSASGTKRLILGVNLFDLSMATSTTAKDQIWSFEVTGLESVIMEVVSVTGGNVTVKGKAVA